MHVGSSRVVPGTRPRPECQRQAVRSSRSMRHRSAKGNAMEPCFARVAGRRRSRTPQNGQRGHRRTELSPHVGARTACARCASTARQLGDERARHHVLTVARSRETNWTVSYTHLRAHETPEHLVCRLLLEKKKKK